jgi:hypothetical protein
MRERIRSLVRKNKKHTSVVTTVTPTSSGVPHAMVLTGLLREQDPRRPIHVSGHRSWRKAMRRDLAVWTSPLSVRFVIAVARSFVRQAGERHAHRAIEHRSRPPHPASRP